MHGTVCLVEGGSSFEDAFVLTGRSIPPRLHQPSAANGVDQAPHTAQSVVPSSDCALNLQLACFPLAAADGGVDRVVSAQAGPHCIRDAIFSLCALLTHFSLAAADGGVDRVVSAQAALTRDTTYLVNGAQVGAHDIFTVGGWLLICWSPVVVVCSSV